jgi:hypothetical protein
LMTRQDMPLLDKDLYRCNLTLTSLSVPTKDSL